MQVDYVEANKIPKQIMDLAEAVGNFIEYWGFKKIHGKVWTLIFLADRPVDAQYLINNLGVSKSLTSMTIKDLLEYSVILETDKAGPTNTYVANPDIYTVIVDVLLNREAKMLGEVKTLLDNISLLPVERLNNFASKERINDLTKMTNVADTVFKALITLKNLSLKNFKKALQLRRAHGS